MQRQGCPICEKNDTEKIFEKGNLDKPLINVICKNCGLVYIDSRPPEEEYQKFLEKDFLSDKNLTDVEQLENKLRGSDDEIKKTIITFLNFYLKDGQKILEVGCGAGTLLHLLKEKNKAEVLGIEPSELNIDAAKKYYNLDLFKGSLAQFAVDETNSGKFDVIILHHVFEHLPEPIESLLQIKKLLKSDGILYVGVPNIMNIKKRPEIFFQIAHPFSYSPHSLKLILEKAGFGVIKFNRDAGYPGGMEVLCRGGATEIPPGVMGEGGDAAVAVKYVKSLNKRFGILRTIRDKALFFLSQRARIFLGRFFYKLMKRRLSEKEFFLFFVLPMSFLAGMIFILRHLFIFIDVRLRGDIYSFFSFVNPDPLATYIPFVRDVFDGIFKVVDGRVYEAVGFPNLWTQLSPILVAPLFWLTKSLSVTFVLGHFIVAFLSCILFYLICRLIIGNRYFCILYSVILIISTLIFNYLFPVSLSNIKLILRAILPFGSPVGEVLLSKYVSFSILPGLVFFVAGALLIFLAVKKEKKIFTYLAGLNIALLMYVVLTDVIYLYSALFVCFLIFLCLKDFLSVKKIIIIYLISFFGSVPYWFNYLQIRALPHFDEFYRRLSGEITHQFRISHWPQYIAYLIMACLVLYWGKKNKKIKESILVAGFVLAAAVVLNMQIVTGFNPAPSAWAYHQNFFGFALGWLVIFYWLYDYLRTKIRPIAVKSAFFIIFMMLTAKTIYAEIYAAKSLSPHHYIPENIYKSLKWLDKNTPRHSVVATPSLVTNSLITGYTHNNSMFPVAISSPFSLSDIRDRYFLVYKMFGVREEYIRRALEGALPIGDSFAIGQENALQTWLYDDYFYDTSLDSSIYGAIPKDIPEEEKKAFFDTYRLYPSKKEYLFNKYRVDYIYYGPYEKKISENKDFFGTTKIYEADGVEIYEVSGT